MNKTYNVILMVIEGAGGHELQELIYKKSEVAFLQMANEQGSRSLDEVLQSIRNVNARRGENRIELAELFLVHGNPEQKDLATQVLEEDGRKSQIGELERAALKIAAQELFNLFLMDPSRRFFSHQSEKHQMTLEVEVLVHPGSKAQ